ncbi:SRPBCC family protein [Nitrogeniibacter mangrovi]|uniref:SRPBCC family protein n=1 Tax=Nitrogeniibacter mangrovi TaxID=2016596 RepID=A0A6C1B797_9RHOO|nr:SRPBCC family protein [Nitrogeniibacter mangrovi]QID19233.1 SRPBCC family protein [Nitrogeniibacter mangrovi]
MTFSRIAKAGAALACAGFALGASAAGTLSVDASTLLKAPPAAVWHTVGNFGDLNWHPVIASTEIIKGKAGHAGATRKLTTQDGAVIVEEELSQDNAHRKYAYRIVESPLPVTDYVSELEVTPEGKGSRVSWRSHFKAKEGVSDADAHDAIAGIYSAGFEALQKQFAPAGH